MSEPTTRTEKLTYALEVIGIETKNQKAIITTFGNVNKLAMSSENTIVQAATNNADAEVLNVLKQWLLDYLGKHDGKLPTSWLNEFTEEIFMKYYMSKMLAQYATDYCKPKPKADKHAFQCRYSKSQ